MKSSAILFFKNLVFTLIVPGTVVGLVPWLIVRGQPITSTGDILAALVLFTIGGAVYLRCIWGFASVGRGTPAPIDAPKELVVKGLYRYTRNPMYVGVLIAILGWAALFSAPDILFYELGTVVFVHLFIIFYEEPHLRKIFSTEYERYCSQVGRWLPLFMSRSISVDHEQNKNG